MDLQEITRLCTLAEQAPPLGRSIALLNIVMPLLRALGYTEADLVLSETDNYVEVQLDAVKLRVVSFAAMATCVLKPEPGLWTDGTTYQLVVETPANPVAPVDARGSLASEAKPELKVVIWALGQDEHIPYGFLEKGQVNIDGLLAWGTQRQMADKIVRYLKGQIQSPSDAFVNFLLQQTVGHSLTGDKDMWRAQVQNGLVAFSSLKGEVRIVEKIVEKEIIVEKIVERLVEKTQPETEPEKILRLVREMLKDDIEAERLSLRPTSSYVAVLLDNNGRKQVCRLHLGPMRQVGFINAERKEDRFAIPEDWTTLLPQFKTAIVAYKSEESSDVQPN